MNKSYRIMERVLRAIEMYTFFFNLIFSIEYAKTYFRTLPVLFDFAVFLLFVFIAVVV